MQIVQGNLRSFVSSSSTLLLLAAGCSTDSNTFSSNKSTFEIQRKAGTNNADFSPPDTFINTVDGKAAVAGGAVLPPPSTSLPPLVSTDSSNNQDSTDDTPDVSPLDQTILSACYEKFAPSQSYQKMSVIEVGSAIQNTNNQILYDDSSSQFDSQWLVLLKISSSNANNSRILLSKPATYCLYYEANIANKVEMSVSCDTKVAFVTLNFTGNNSNLSASAQTVQCK